MPSKTFLSLLAFYILHRKLMMSELIIVNNTKETLKPNCCEEGSAEAKGVGQKRELGKHTGH